MQDKIKMDSSWEGKVFPLALIVSFGFMVVYVSLGLLGVIPSLESGAVIGEASRWCERVSTSMFREPVNALSNLGFMITGLLMFWVLSKDVRRADSNQFHGLTPISMLYAGAAIYLGPGSMLMHGTHTDWGQWADNLSMVMYILLPWLINVKEMGRWSVKTFFTVYIAIVVIDGLMRWFDFSIGIDLFGLSIGLWCISEALYRFWSPLFRWLSGLVGFVVCAVFGIFPTEIIAEFDKYWWVLLFWIPALLSPQAPRYRRKYSPWFFAGQASYLIAFSIWLTGVPDSSYCDPDRFFQAHGIWHVLSAVATWCFFMFLRTERKLQQKET